MADEHQKWEYHLGLAPMSAPGEPWADQYLKPLGDEGWEAVAYLPEPVHRILFKRPKIEPQETGAFFSY